MEYTKVNQTDLEGLITEEQFAAFETSCTSGVTDMSELFWDSKSFNQDIGFWDTSSDKFMSSMFANDTAFNQDIGYWNTSTVTDMSCMFYGANSFNQNLTGWCVGDVTSSELFSSDSGLDDDDVPTFGTEDNCGK